MNSFKGIGSIAVAIYVAYTIFFWERYFVNKEIDSYRWQQYREARLHKLSEDALEKQLHEVNAFGQVAQAHWLACSDYGPSNPWDYTCFLYYKTGSTASSPRLKFGVMVDANHATQMSALYPADASVRIPNPLHQ
jgi:hypothetical protein